METDSKEVQKKEAKIEQGALVFGRRSTGKVNNIKHVYPKGMSE